MTRESPGGVRTVDSARTRDGDPGTTYVLWATSFLVVTLLGGLWLRAAVVHPDLLAGFSYGNLLHAHSHVAFFGWGTMAVFALLVRWGREEAGSGWIRWHAATVALLSAAAFVGFLRSGYDATTITISVAHVVLWGAFVAGVWESLGRAAPLERRYGRGALVFLAIAGAGAMLPALVMARGVMDPWINRMAIEAFLTPFAGGWFGIAAAGALYAALSRPRFTWPVLALLCAGVLPSALLHPLAPPPAEWMPVFGRVGVGMIGLASLLLAADLLREWRTLQPLLRVAAVAVTLKATAELLAAAGPALPFVGVRPLAIAYLHLVLLGVFTPALLHAALRIRGRPWSTGLFSLGLAKMLAALVAMGWAPAMKLAILMGINAVGLLHAALTAGVMLTLGAVLLLRPGGRWAARDTEPSTEPAARVPHPMPT
jgi:hypothetical protein